MPRHPRAGPPAERGSSPSVRRLVFAAVLGRRRHGDASPFLVNLLTAVLTFLSLIGYAGHLHPMG